MVLIRVIEVQSRASLIDSLRPGMELQTRPGEKIEVCDSQPVIEIRISGACRVELHREEDRGSDTAAVE